MGYVSLPVDATDDWRDENGTVLPTDSVDVWPALVSGSDAPLREWLPTTERSLIWDQSPLRMFKFYNQERLANRFHQNGSQFMDQANACLNVSTPVGGVGVPPSCLVCSPDAPCLFDVLADPTELHNLASSLPDVVKTMAAKMATYRPYVPSLSPEELACYTCGDNNTDPPKRWWQGFSGPCCVPSH